MVIHAFGDEHTLGYKYCDSAIFSQYKQWLDTNILRLNRDEKTYTRLDNSVWIEKLCGKLKCAFKFYAKKGNTNLDTFNSVMPTVFASMSADKATLPVPSKETLEAVISPDILKFLAVSNAVAVAALPVVS